MRDILTLISATTTTSKTFFLNFWLAIYNLIERRLFGIERLNIVTKKSLL